MKTLLVALAIFGVVASWWFWWAHLLTWIPAALLYFPVLRKLQNDSPLMVVAALKHQSIIGLSSESIAWLNKNGHAIIMWGASKMMGQHIKVLMAFSFIAIFIVAFRQSWWWLLEFMLQSWVMISLYDGFRPITEEKLLENTSRGRDSFLKTEIAPLVRDIIASDMREILRKDSNNKNL